MIRIKTIKSEVDIQENIVENFKQYRTINQTALYLKEGADHYYNPNKKFTGAAYDYSKIAQILETPLTKKKEARAVIVSLGCGNCEKDKILIEKLQQAGHNVSFFGVDTSMAMIEKADKQIFQNVTFEVNLICADFGATGFREQLDSIIGDYDIGIYLFMGNTFGNLNQSYVADVLRNVLRKGDYMLLDIVGFETITTTLQAKLFQRYRSYLANPADVAFSLYPLEALGISSDDGVLTLQVTTDDATQARVFKFGFKVINPIDFSIKNEKFNLVPNERVSLRIIMVYDLHELKKFLAIKQFKLKEKIVGEFVNQLLLERQ